MSLPPPPPSPIRNLSLDAPHRPEWGDYGELLAAAEEMADVGSWQWEVASGRIVWSPQLHRILGYPLDTTPTAELFFSRMHPEDRERLNREGAFELARGAPPRMDFRVVRANGDVRWLFMDAQATIGSEGLPIFMRGVVMDVTERRLLEGRLRQAEKLEAVGRLACGVAHDFNNLLAIVRANSEIARRTQSTRALDAIDEATRLAAGLTRQLLAIGRHGESAPAIVDVHDTLRDTLSFLRGIVNETVDIAFEPCAAAPRVRIDPHELQQVLLNLATNAEDAMPDGGRITVTTALEAEPDGGTWVAITVSDTGIGIPADLLERVFEPYFSTKAPGKGTGLGLSIVFGAVSRSRGRVHVTSTPSQGTSFHVHLPLADGPLDETPRQETP